MKRHIKKLLYKYGAFIVWILVILVTLLTHNIWYGASLLTICITLGILFRSGYEHQATHKEKVYRRENTVGMLIVGLVLLSQNWVYVLITFLLCIIAHIMIHNVPKKNHDGKIYEYIK